MNCKKIFLLVFIFGWNILLNGQSDKYVDSLLLEIKYASDDQKITLVKNLARNFFREKPQIVDSTINTLDQLRLSSLDSAELCLFRGRAAYYLYDFKKFNSNVETAFDILDRYEDPETENFYFLRYQQYSLKALLKFHSGEVREALGYHLKANDNAKKSGDKNIMGMALVKLGSFYIEDKNYEKALEYLTKSQKLKIPHSPNNEKYFTDLYSEISIAYTSTNQLDSAKKYIQLVPPSKKNLRFFMTVANYNQKLGRHPQAIALLDSLVFVVKENGPEHWISSLEFMRAESYYELNQFQKAESTWLSARLGFMKSDDKNSLVDVSKSLYEYYRNRGQFEKALIFHEEYKTISDSTLYEKHITVLEGLEASHALSIKEQENQNLKEQELSNTKIIQRQRLLGLLSLVCILALSMLFYSYFKNAKTKKNLNNSLRQANDDLRNRNQKIKSIADELRFVTDNFPQEVARLDNNFNLTFSNEHFKNLFHISSHETAVNVFQLLGFSKNDQNNFLKNLDELGKIAFTWIPTQKPEIYQIQIVKTENEKQQKQYLMVFEDITLLKEKAKAERKELENILKDMEDNYQQFDQERMVLNVSLETKKRELASKMMQITKRNNDLEKILDDLREVYTQSNSATKFRISKVINQLNDVLDIEDGWKTFNTYFQEIHPSFIKELQSRCSELSNNELRHCTFIRLGLSNKEVADMLNVSNKTVEVARYRIKKKLNLTKEVSLSKYISNID